MTAPNDSRKHRADATPNLRPSRVCFLQTLGLLLLGLIPLPMVWARPRAVLDSARSTEPNRGDREATAAGYYEGLIGGGDGPKGLRGELALALLGTPVEWTRFDAANVTRPLPDGDFLQFELKPDVDKTLFGRTFTTNSHGMRDREYSVEKPPNTFRIVVLGSSMDMGWGISAEEGYVNRLEDWLNLRAAESGTGRRFEVLNFAVAAYSPLQRLETYRRKARAFRPDLVLYSATTLDARLLEIHLCDLFRDHGDLGFDFLRARVLATGLSEEDLRVDREHKLVHKDLVKQRIRPHYWPIQDETLGELAAECRSDGAEIACMIIPRVGKADAPAERAESVARLHGIARHHALPMFDLSGTFDGADPAAFEIAAWDDHPNEQGHQRLFRALARALLSDRTVGPTLGLHAATATEPTADATLPTTR